MSLADHIMGIEQAAPRKAKRVLSPVSLQDTSGQRFFGPTGLQKALHDYIDAIKEPTRLGGEWLHASSLYTLCTRQHAIIRENAPSLDSEAIVESTPTPRRVIYDVGKATHYAVRNKYLGPSGLLYGAWKCRQCQAVVESTMPERCGCGGEFRYKETVFRNDELKILGAPDGRLVRCPNEMPISCATPLIGMGILEIKSKEGALFKMIQAPEPAHCFQAQIYMWLTGLRWAIVLYVSKSQESKSPFKDWGILADERMGGTIRRIVEESKGQGERKCQTPDDKRAGKCFARGVCFFGERLA